ncbi:hypothetical protein OD91_0782 [Lutibacter sp. Hel_I_33_5]|uniref:DUF5723 family protein n=1 Tax=Lutibacter sp. Hel_I_33_5 TaxID=1566289 RepID=UPI0011A91E72|nr:DUF5723 family protein [Lutibacter sp. Hel_I_33_5]TVZ55528.1 hypothetical protein OD91_0782 [Lutibacter sp. Hel_I_33_5]
MKKIIYTTSLLFFVLTGSVKAQEYLSFYNLKDYVIQTQNVSPVFLPKYKITFGTPINLGLDINSGIKLNDLLVESGNKTKWDFDSLNSVAEDKNILSTDIALNLFTLGIKTKKGSISFFANAKANLTWQISKDFTNILATGFNNNFSLSNERMGLMAYSEIGIGYTRKFLKDKLAIGIRLKSLSGIANGEIANNAQFSLDIDPTSSHWTFKSANSTVNTAGLADTDNISFLGKNKGFGMDLGFSYQLNEKLTLELAINDMGSIEWTENVKNYNINDTTGAVFTGVDLQAGGDILDEVESTIGNVLGTTETSKNYKTKIGTKTFLSAKYKLSEKNILQVTYFSNNNPYIDVKPSYALGYNRALNKSTYGVTLGSRGFGANFALQLGFLQLYAAVDDISNISGKIEETTASNARLGLNFLFGYRGKGKVIKDESEVLAEKEAEKLEKENKKIEKAAKKEARKLKKENKKKEKALKKAAKQKLKESKKAVSKQ